MLFVLCPEQNNKSFVILLFCSDPRTNTKITDFAVATDSLADAVLHSDYMLRVYCPNAGKPGDGMTQGLLEGRGSVANIQL